MRAGWGGGSAETRSSFRSMTASSAASSAITPTTTIRRGDRDRTRSHEHPGQRKPARPAGALQGLGVSGQIDYGLGNRFALTSVTAYRAYNSQFGNDNDLTPLPNSAQEIDLDFWSFSQKLRLNGSIGSLVDFTLGGLYLDQRTINGAVLDLRFTPFPLQFVQRDPVNADTFAGFGQLIFNLTDCFTLVSGIRYTKESKSYTFVRRN